MEPEEPVKTPPSVATRLSGLFSSAHDLEARGGDSRMVHKSSTVVLRLKDLPPNVAEALASLDVDGDGTIDVGELHHGAKETERTVSKSKFYRKMLIILLGVCLAQLASFCGVMVGSINLTKESHVYDGRMTTRDGLSVVQTAQATSSLPLASTLSDDAFLELKTVGLTSPTGATIHLTVLGFVRMPGAFGTVTLITHIGRIVLDGTSLSYIDDTQQAIFEAAGFSVNGATRRLLQVRALFGIFNAIGAVSAAGINSTAAVAPPSLPDNFIMHAQRLTPCVPVSPPAGQRVPLFTGNYTGGPLPRTGVDLCDVLNIDASLLSSTYNDDGSLDQRFIAMSYTMFRMGSNKLRVEYLHPLVPGQMLVEVLDASNASAPVQFSYQVDTTDRGIQLVGGSDFSIPALVGPIAYYNSTQVSQQDLVSEALGAPMDYLGNTTLAGEDVRIWAVHLNNNTMTAYWYDTADTREVRRIAFGDFGVLNVVSISALDGGPEANAHLFMQPHPSATNVGDATTITPGDPLPLPLPTKISLDPFTPFIADFKVAPTRRRRLLEMKEQAEPAQVHFDLEALANSSFPGLLGRRGLLQYTGGCSASNKCPIKPGIFPGGGGYGNQAITIAVPAVPVGFAIGPIGRAPCMYESSVSVPLAVATPLPITLTGTLGVELCSDLSGYSQVYCSMSASAGIPNVPDKSPLSLFSWQIASVGLSLVNEVQELQCRVDAAGNPAYTSQLLSTVMPSFDASGKRSTCQCLNNTGQRSGIGFEIGGPDIPGFSVMAIPPVSAVVSLTQLAPFLASIKLRPTATWTYFPYFCGLTRNDIGFYITVSVDIIFFKDSIDIFDTGYSFLSALLPNGLGPMGTVLPGFVKQGKNAADVVTDEMVAAFLLIAQKIQNMVVDWAAVEQLINAGAAGAAELKNAASTYFSSAYGTSNAAANAALTRIFKPPAIYEYGCFDGHWEGGECTARTGSWAGNRCYAWSIPYYVCGSIKRCIANCPAPPPPFKMPPLNKVFKGLGR